MNLSLFMIQPAQPMDELISLCSTDRLCLFLFLGQFQVDQPLPVKTTCALGVYPNVANTTQSGVSIINGNSITYSYFSSFSYWLSIQLPFVLSIAKQVLMHRFDNHPRIRQDKTRQDKESRLSISVKKRKNPSLDSTPKTDNDTFIALAVSYESILSSRLNWKQTRLRGYAHIKPVLLLLLDLMALFLFSSGPNAFAKRCVAVIRQSQSLFFISMEVLLFHSNPKRRSHLLCVCVLYVWERRRLTGWSG